MKDVKSITIYDIAKEAGVSPATVSRVLTSSANVRADKKERVLQLIEKYNFKPNALAKGLADTKSKIIGLLLADVQNPFYATLSVACENCARERGYTLLTANSLDVLTREKELLESFQEKRVDAIIQVGGSVDDLTTNIEYSDFVNRITTITPMVVAGKLDGTQCHMVQIDNVKVIDLQMEYLLSLNHKKIAFVGGNMDVISTYMKGQRYKQILQRNKIDFEPDFFATDCTYGMEDGYHSMNRLFEIGKIPTAVISINDFAAIGVVKSILEHGYRIPEDISVVSQDNTYLADMMTPTLTSVDYNYHEYGRMLIDTAIAVIEGKEVPMLQVVTPKLVIRKSSGALSTETEEE